MISQIEFEETVSEEEWQELEVNLHNNNFLRIGKGHYPTNRIEAIYVEE